MHKYFFVVFSCLFFPACGQKAVVETDLVKSHILNVETISDTTDILNFVKGIPSGSYYNDIIISDNRLLRYYGIPFKSLRIIHDEGHARRLNIELFKESEVKDAERIKKALTDKLGEPQQSEYDENIFEWVGETSFYQLEVLNKERGDNSKLLINLVGNSYHQY